MVAIPFGKRSAQRAGSDAGPPNALARLGGAAAEATPVADAARVRRSPYIDAHAEIGGALLAQRSAEPPLLLGWLRGNNQLSIPARGGTVEGRAYLLVGVRHAAIAAWARTGERLYAELEPGGFALLADGAQLSLRAGNALFVLSGGARQRAGELAALLALPAVERLLEAARLNRVAGGRAALAQSAALLERARELGSVRARWLGFLCAPESIDRDALADAVASERVTPAALAELWQSFGLAPESALALVEELIPLGEQALPFALALHERARDPRTIGLAQARAALALAGARAAAAKPAEPADERTQELASVLAPGGLARRPETPPPAPRAALSEELIRERLTHPASRARGFDFWRTPALLARVGKRPAPEDLSDYCEPLLPDAHPAATRAVAAACRALGLPPLPAYVSRGKKSLGICSQRGNPASLLVGVEHLSEGSAYALSERELCFAIGAECAHLRFGHGRVTRRELWAGALAHTRDGLTLALGLLPVLRGARLGMRMSRALGRVPEPALQRVLAVLSGVEIRRSEPASGPRALALSHFNEELLVVHRVTQLSADRAGLLLCGDLRASLRALLLVRPDYRALLAELESSALAGDLLARPGSPMLADLIVRSAALIDFYLSDDYRELTGFFVC